MAMRINTNISAMTAHNVMQKTDQRLSQAIERLSSGMRINKASDDAAGLTISEKMRTQIKSINRSLFNVQDGSSLIQVAEGALNEIQSMLQRMRELALQSSNDTLTTTDRLEIQKEVVQLRDEIDRVSRSTTFNTKVLLDGTCTAVISSSNPECMDGIVVDQVLTFSDFSIVVWPKIETDDFGNQVLFDGRAEVQRSHIFTNIETGQVANKDTTLQSLSNFYDPNGYFLLEHPQVLHLLGKDQRVEIHLSRDITIEQLTDRILAAMTTDQLGNGLGFLGSSAEYDNIERYPGQIELASGRVGEIGRVNFTGEEAIVKALGFQVVVPPEDPVYSIVCTNVGDQYGLQNTTTTQVAGHRAPGLIQGLELMFEPPLFTKVESEVSEKGIRIESLIKFTVADSAGNIQSITINPGGYTMKHIVEHINETLSLVIGHKIRVALDDDSSLIFASSNSGSAAIIDIQVDHMPNSLGITSGKRTGVGGSQAYAESNKAFPNDENWYRGYPYYTTYYPWINYDYSATRIYPDTNTLKRTAFYIRNSENHSIIDMISITKNYTNLQSIVDHINQQIVNNDLAAVVTDDNRLRFVSNVDGYASNFDLLDARPDAWGVNHYSSEFKLALMLPNSSNGTGTGGTPASQRFVADDIYHEYGFYVGGTSPTDDLDFTITDPDGRTINIVIPAASIPSGQAFHSAQSIAEIINTAAASAGAYIGADVDPNTYRLKIFATRPGLDGTLAFTDNSPLTSLNRLEPTLGIQPQSYQNGKGDYEYRLHVKDNSIQFQIGPAMGNIASVNIIRLDTKALGIEELDLSTVDSAQLAMGAIDLALSKVSAERAKLGAIENRLTYTHNSLRVALQNTTAAESRIRDVDMASQIIEMTQAQILFQSGSAMIAQANVTPQAVLELLR